MSREFDKYSYLESTTIFCKYSILKDIKELIKKIDGEDRKNEYDKNIIKRLNYEHKILRDLHKNLKKTVEIMERE